MEEYLSLKEVAQLLHVNARTVQNEVLRGKLEAFKVGKVYRFKRESVQKYVDSQTVKPEEVEEEDTKEKQSCR